MDINVAAGTMQIVRLEYSIVAKDAGGNVRSHFGYFVANLRNQGGTVTFNEVHPLQLESDLGVISDIFATVVGINKGTLTLVANASGMTTTEMSIYMNVISQGTNNVIFL
jgi:hypothetical protein